ncbi:MAG: PIN domain nuclease [Acidobacteria bacterium]|nr:MAG: PIN domain nuclease [Acidobacteriota bacterium]
MRVLIDSSAWVEFLNGTASPQRRAVAELVAGEDEICTCGVIVAEVFQGLRRHQGRDRLQRLFQDLLFLEPSGIGSYFRAAEVYRLLRGKGVTVRSTIDCLIAVVAEENGCYILTRDKDLDLILQSGAVDSRSWPSK